MTIRTRLLVFCQSIGLVLVAGCVGLEFNSKVPDELEAIEAGISIGEATRDQIHADFGEPLVSSDDGSVEVRRAASGHDVETLIWLGPVPPLFGRSDVTGYLMVSYDEHGIVQAVRTDFTAEWEPNFSDRGDHQSIALSLPPYKFHARYAWPAYEEFLVVDLPDEWPPLPPHQCRLVYVPYTSTYVVNFKRLFIDDSLVLTYRDDADYGPNATTGRLLFEFLLPVGNHSAAVELEDYEEERIGVEWNCLAGETLRLSDQVKFGDRPDRRTWLSPGYGPVGSLHVFPGGDLLASGDRKLVVYHSGSTGDWVNQD